MKKRLLITGVSGLLGSNLAHCLKDRYEVWGFYHSHKAHFKGMETQCVDLRQRFQAESYVKHIDPHIVIHSAAQANLDVCEEHKEEAWESNVKATANILDILQGNPAKFIYISSDQVYDGEKGNFSEKSATVSKNYYAATKLEAERLALNRPGSLVLRTNFFGWSLFGKRNLAGWLIDELRSKRSVQGFTDAIFSSIYTFDMAEIMHRMIEKELSGIYNCASRTSISKYEFLVAIAKGAGLDKSLIRPSSIDQSGLKASRGKILSLNVSKLEKDLNGGIPSIHECIAHFIADLPKDYGHTMADHSIGKAYYPPVSKIPYGRQCLDDDDIASVVEVLKTGNLTQGLKIEQFERGLAEVTGASFVAAVNSGTSALHLACLAAGIGAKDEVITSTNTFVASSNCVLYCGGKPVFGDIDPRTYNLSPQSLEKKITSKTKAVIPVHFAGQSCDMGEIVKIVRAAEKRFGHKIYIIEDASHALGSSYQGAKVGSCTHADMTVMSFHPVKHITTGEGGAVFTNDKALHRKLCLFRSHGITSFPEEFVQPAEAFSNEAEGDEERIKNPWYYEQQCLGHNYRITDIQCALGVSQLKKLPAFMRRRREIIKIYNEAFSGFDLVTIPYESSLCQSNFHLYVILIDFKRSALNRAQLMMELRERGIVTQVHYIPVHTQPYYQEHLGTHWGDHPVAEKYYQQCLSLPLYPGMQDGDAQRIAGDIKSILTKKT